ncbi:histidine phosphatase family protein [Bombiscardovia coagulans]|uniref:Phosphoglycerate mutase n=1 Tax=Bombiscardovia coagulans TaxID=686666 RepID=A0A261EVT6_9BIFI|nr:histidine phosphatase family protein [Bombiscardovia coagulans]OZG50945.1 phosphoglycerate mutase [Bombiscardovia coagulans]
MSEQHVHSIILVRHGQTDYNAARRMQGQTDIPLNAVGRWQAQQTAQTLRHLYVDAHHSRQQLIVSSDLDRAYSTAQAFADVIGVSINTDSRLREREFGEWEGLTAQQVKEQWPEDYYAWLTSAGGEVKHGAETKAEVGRRGLSALNDWSHRAGDDTDLFLFTHGSWISQTVQSLMGLSEVHPEGVSLGSIRNAHWVTLIPRQRSSQDYLWALLDFNRGPAIAESVDWNNPSAGQ